MLKIYFFLEMKMINYDDLLMKYFEFCIFLVFVIYNFLKENEYYLNNYLSNNFLNIALMDFYFLLLNY